jgi:hypothetical protein
VTDRRQEREQEREEQQRAERERLLQRIARLETENAAMRRVLSRGKGRK